MNLRYYNCQVLQWWTRGWIHHISRPDIQWLPVAVNIFPFPLNDPFLAFSSSFTSQSLAVEMYGVYVCVLFPFICWFWFAFWSSFWSFVIVQRRTDVREILLLLFSFFSSSKSIPHGSPLGTAGIIKSQGQLGLAEEVDLPSPLVHSPLLSYPKTPPFSPKFKHSKHALFNSHPLHLSPRHGLPHPLSTRIAHGQWVWGVCAMPSNLSSLPKREKDILCLRFFQTFNQKSFTKFVINAPTSSGPSPSQFRQQFSAPFLPRRFARHY